MGAAVTVLDIRLISFDRVMLGMNDAGTDYATPTLDAAASKPLTGGMRFGGVSVHVTVGE